MKTFLTPLLLLLLLASQAGAGILNGDFSAAGASPEPFEDWTTEVDSMTGLLIFDRPTDGGGLAVFKDQGLVGSSQLSQSFSLPSGSLSLSFEFSISTLPSGAPLGLLLDSFQATLFDSIGGLTGLLPSAPGFSAFYSIDNDGSEYFDTTYVTRVDLGGGIRKITINLASLAPQDLFIDFLLNGTPDGFSTRVELDNVVLAQNSTVPEPASFLIWSASLGIACVWQRRRSSRGTSRKSR